MKDIQCASAHTRRLCESHTNKISDESVQPFTSQKRVKRKRCMSFLKPNYNFSLLYLGNTYKLYGNCAVDWINVLWIYDLCD